jgi:hypothetical protein
MMGPEGLLIEIGGSRGCMIFTLNSSKEELRAVRSRDMVYIHTYIDVSCKYNMHLSLFEYTSYIEDLISTYMQKCLLTFRLDYKLLQMHEFQSVRKCAHT